jgi:hypothetical protein
VYWGDFAKVLMFVRFQWCSALLIRDVAFAVQEVFNSAKGHILTMAFMLLSVAFLIWGTAEVGDTSHCQPLIDNIHNVQSTNATLLTDFGLNWVVRVQQTFPRGSVHVIVVDEDFQGLEVWRCTECCCFDGGWLWFLWVQVVSCQGVVASLGVERVPRAVAGMYMGLCAG